MSSERSRRQVKSGSTRSMPSCSGVGNMSPVSTTTIRPSYSTTVMFLPISPRPPSGRTRRVPLTPAPRGAASNRAQQAVALEHDADLRGLLGRRLDQRQPEAPHVVTEHPDGGLDRDRVDRDRHRGPDVLERLVDLVAPVGLV